jgi:hypothetical protein
LKIVSLIACHLLICITLAANAVIVVLDVRKFLDLDPYIILFVIFSCSFCCLYFFFKTLFVLLNFLAWCLFQYNLLIRKKEKKKHLLCKIKGPTQNADCETKQKAHEINSIYGDIIREVGSGKSGKSRE